MIGFHPEMTEAAYHADPCPQPSLSSSIAKVIIEQTPRHAMHAHPRLFPQRVAESARRLEMGTAVHTLILGRGKSLEIIKAANYQSKDARQKRDDALAAGLTPILADDYATAQAVSRAFAEQIAEIDDCEGFAAATPELVAIARDETGAWMRALMDKFEDRGSTAIIWDVKTTGQSAAPQAIGRKIADMGYEVQSAFYERVVATLRPELTGRIRFRWAFIETEPPHLLTIAELDNMGLEIGRRKVAAAIALWNRCISTGAWPGYPNRIIMAEYPNWSETSWLAREEREAALIADGGDPFIGRVYAPKERPSTMMTELIG